VQEHQQQQTAEFLECILSEFGSKSTAVNYRMPLEFHKNAHKAFETQFGLFQLLQIAVTTLSQMGSSDAFTERIDSSVAILQLFSSVLGWEFGTNSWNSVDSLTTTGSIIRPPVEWHLFIGQVNIVHAMFRMHNVCISRPNVNDSSCLLPRTIRQIVLQLASLSGPMFQTPSDQIQYASALCEGSLFLSQQVAAGIVVKEESTIMLDVYQIISRLVANFRLPLLLEIATFAPLLKCATEVGCTLLMDHFRECENAGGDPDSMIHRDWREETLGQLLECVVLISGDHWLWHGGTDQSQYQVQKSLSDIVCPLFDGFVICRIQMTR
jgi:hypothetical protein